MASSPVLLTVIKPWMCAICYGFWRDRRSCVIYQRDRNPKQIGFITIKAGMISVLLLAALYLCLFYLGATSHAVSVFADQH